MEPKTADMPSDRGSLDNFADASRFANHAANAINLLARLLVRLQGAVHGVDTRQQALASGLAAQQQRLAAIEILIQQNQERAAQKAPVEEARFNALATGLKDIGREATGRRLRVAARTLSAFCVSAHRNASDEAVREDARLMAENLATDLDLDVFTPAVGQPFDPRTMAAARGQRELVGDPRSAVVDTVVAPGFRHDGTVLEAARVLLKQLGPVAAANHTSPITDGSERCRIPAGAVQ